jgi:hypothetical protein
MGFASDEGGPGLHIPTPDVLCVAATAIEQGPQMVVGR